MIRMRILLFLFLFFTYSVSAAYGGQWEFFNADKNGIYYYDRKSMMNETKSYVSVWMKEIPTKKMSREYKRMHQLREEPHYVFSQELINCDAKRYAVQQRIFYDQKDSIISSCSFKNNLEWTAISPGTFLEGLSEKICR